MYKTHFGLSENPFSIAPDPRYLFMSERHREALAHLLYGIESNGGFVLLTGEVGTGKTTVCRCLLEQVPENVDIALILNPKLSVEELLATICDELHIRYPKGRTSIKGFIDRLNTRLLEAHARGRNTVLIVDEAQNLSTDVLEQLRLLTNLETNRHKLLQIILLGQPELREALARPELRQLAQRITARFHLEPLSRSEVAAYVKHRLSVAGLHERLFPDSAINRLYHISKGIPRRINVLCDRALLGAYAQNARRVDARTLEKAAEEVDGVVRKSGHLGWYITALVATGMLALAFTFYPGRPGTASVPGPVPRADGTKPVATATPGPTAPKASLTGEPGRKQPTVLTWPGDKPPAASRQLAFRELFRLWHIEYIPDQDIAPCPFAETHGLRCLSRTGSLGGLAHANRPAVLKLRGPQDQVFYATLTALDEDKATFTIAGNAVTIPSVQLMSQWFGRYTLLWRAPPGFTRDIRPGDAGEAIDWLNRSLTKAMGSNMPVPDEGPFTGQMVRLVKAFQQRNRLNPDGIVGAMTIIHLNTENGAHVPLLSGPQART